MEKEGSGNRSEPKTTVHRAKTIEGETIGFLGGCDYTRIVPSTTVSINHDDTTAVNGKTPRRFGSCRLRYLQYDEARMKERLDREPPTRTRQTCRKFRDIFQRLARFAYRKSD